MALYDTLGKLVESIFVNSRGWIESITVVSQDGMPITTKQSNPVNPDSVAAATAAIGGAVSSVVELLNSKDFEKIDIQLSDKRLVLIRKYMDFYIICITRPRSNLGFVSLILESYLKTQTP